MQDNFLESGRKPVKTEDAAKHEDADEGEDDGDRDKRDEQEEIQVRDVRYNLELLC